MKTFCETVHDENQLSIQKLHCKTPALSRNPKTSFISESEAARLLMTKPA
jgi:hypothetical protein